MNILHTITDNPKLYPRIMTSVELVEVIITLRKISKYVKEANPGTINIMDIDMIIMRAETEAAREFVMWMNDLFAASKALKEYQEAYE